jgi:hypothetical protein
MRILVVFFLVGVLQSAAAQSMDSGAEPGDSAPRSSRDPLLVGKWVAVLSQDEKGLVRSEWFEMEYLSDGKTIFNREALLRKFNHQQDKLGNAHLSLDDFDRLFPRVTWKTADNRIILTFQSRFGKNDLAYHYRLHGDTLTTVNTELSGTLSKMVAVRRGE